jgi:protein-tyrosine-phosphatase
VILFVCTGNVNRSAAAEAVARTGGWAATSAGVAAGASRGNRMAKRMRTAIIARGADPTVVDSHRSRHVDDVDMDGVMFVIGFQPSHQRWINEHRPGVPYGTIVDIIPRRGWPTKVPDPAFDAALVEPVAHYLAVAVLAAMESLP